MKVTVLLLVTCELCWSIRVPVTWEESESDVKQNAESDEEFSVESFKPQDSTEGFNTSDLSDVLQPQDLEERYKPRNEKPIQVEYFDYTAKKPQFAIDVAAFHGVQSPENHYKAYPIRPYTGRLRPELGKHHIFDSRNTVHQPFQDYTKINDDGGYANPVSESYEIFHPYEAETPALKEIYRDPVMTKIRNELENSKKRLQQYEKDAGEPDISQDEYLESPQKTDGKLFPQRYKPAPFEIHRPQRRPVYYRPGPVYKSREHYLNQKLRLPWHHNIGKVRPMHYQPIKNQIHQLRQNHALKYGDARNEYPQEQIYENYSDPKDGQDIYERGKDKFKQLRDNVDESINNAVNENRPADYEKLEVQNSESASNEDENDEEEFIPIKNYAQVRRTESFRHLPRSAALEDAETFDEIKNSPRLREAIKSTKAQTVYSEEGYEDGAYDHAGEQKHASENEGHGGFLKENELSGGKYKAPSISANYEDGKESIYRDQNIHAKKWKDDNKDTKEEENEEETTEEEHEHLLEANNHQTEPHDDENHRNKRENNFKHEFETSSGIQGENIEETQQKIDKQEANFEVPVLDFNSTFFKDSEYLKIAKLKVLPKKDTIKQKYPYYFQNLEAISENSPLRYAENLKHIPKKSKGGTEFYDSRSKFECPEVDDEPDPIPEKLKGNGHPDESDDDNEKQSSTKGDENFDTAKKQPRLKGLGDKIDCFKAKYFGENPLDSPFFKESIISNPEPVFLPNIAAYKLKTPFIQSRENAVESKFHNDFVKLKGNNTSNLFDLIEKLRSNENILQKPVANSNNNIYTLLGKLSNHSNLNNSQWADQSSVYNDVIKNFKTNLANESQAVNISSQSEPANNITYTHFQSKEDITKSPVPRYKRAAPFVYEPYKIIRDSHIQDDSKKSTSTSNISPLIRQLQSSKVIETVNNLTSKDAQHVKRNINTHAYKDIGQKDREIKYGTSKNDKSYEDSDIIDVSIDKRRGEPRYEIKHQNHKSRYTPITNTKSMTAKDYEAQKAKDKLSTTKMRGESGLRPVSRKQIEKPYFDVSKFIPQAPELQKNTASTTVRVKSLLVTSTLRPMLLSYDKNEEPDTKSESDEDYEEYDEDDQEIISIPTSTTQKPVSPLKTQTRAKPQEHLGFMEEPRLQLVTRFRDYKPKNNKEIEYKVKQRETNQNRKPKEQNIERDVNIDPIFKEKKKKITKSTLVTDSKRYGDIAEDDDRMMKDEVDALIGVKHDMDDYEPSYEKDEENKSKERTATIEKGKKNKEDVNDSDKIDENEEYDEDEDENDDDGDIDQDDDNSNIDDDSIEDYDDESDEEEADYSSHINEEDIDNEKKTKITTPEPTKRTLMVTTDAPTPTTASRSAKLQSKPIVTRKKIEIHKELPINKSSPHVSQFKQDIKEIEVIKESRNPLKRKPNKNSEVLDLYKDDNLAKDINKLGVEIFKENLDLRQGPKHGGNYRSAVPGPTISSKSKDDAETSQSEYKKNVEFDDVTHTLTKNESNFNGQKTKTKERILKPTELNDTPITEIRRSNVKYRGRSRTNNAKSQKLIELSDDDDEDPSIDSLENKSYSSSNRGKPMHGGNYRSAKLIKEVSAITELPETRPKDIVRNAALVLNSFVQAAPVLTNKPSFILDPSKRKYYYVDA